MACILQFVRQRAQVTQGNKLEPDFTVMGNNTHSRLRLDAQEVHENLYQQKFKRGV